MGRSTDSFGSAGCQCWGTIAPTFSWGFLTWKMTRAHNGCTWISGLRVYSGPLCLGYIGGFCLAGFELGIRVYNYDLVHLNTLNWRAIGL
ncbi:hypothetical protein BDY19DRAFT_963142 [Irpex rosettiformis]|uniref:Uncharacterized protein n=1 Tax=Irpex rosettiformis TaxID=378272 RepID=A0ACB8TVM1_9APHY|nr:hypothetical protein BDY19DRAFT_963142 [Irpex rosettiformis]